MKNRYLIFIGSFMLFGSLFPGAYFWESHRDGERSCCLFINGTDICNPFVPCTRHAQTDLMGIYDYISRILLVDKGSSFAYHKILQQAQEFVRHVLSSSTIRMYYRYDEQRNVKFYHEIQEATKAAEKTKSTTSATATAAAEKQKSEDAVLAYLIKLGLARRL